MKHYDVIVVGTGIGGLTTTVKLGNIRIAMIEKNDIIGGNSILASSGINGVPTKYQPVIGDKVETFIDDTIKSGKGLSDYGLVWQLAINSREAIRWLSEDMKVDLSEVAQMGGHSMPRTHRGGYTSKLPGLEIVNSLMTVIKQRKSVDIYMNCRLTRILMHDGRVNGIEYETDGNINVLNADHVVLATGGYSADIHSVDSLVKQYRPDLIGFPLTNRNSTCGDGQKIAYRDCQAQLIDMDQIQIHPTGFVNSLDINNPKKILCAELIRGIGGIMISANTGNRFVNELATRDVVSEAILRHCQIHDDKKTSIQRSIAIVMIPLKDYSKAKSHIDFYTKTKLIQEGNLGDLRTLVATYNPNITEDMLLSTINAYNIAKVDGDDLGRTSFGNTFDPKKFYFGLVTPVLHYTMGGLKIDNQSNVISRDNTPIANLYAVGEVGGGLHGYNRLSGSSLLQCVVFGTLAADSILRQLQFE